MRVSLAGMSGMAALVRAAFTRSAKVLRGRRRCRSFYFEIRFRRVIQLERLTFHSMPAAEASATDASDKAAGRRILPDTKPARQSSEKVLNDVMPGRLWHTKQPCRTGCRSESGKSRPG